MWQRVQTIFLSLMVLCMVATVFFPLWGGPVEEGSVKLYPFYLKTADADIYQPYYVIAILAIASITVGIVEITKFQNRILQVKLGAFNSLLMAGTLVVGIFFIRDLEVQYAGTYGIGIFLPPAAMICNSIANRFIRKDEKLVRESDRLR